ncbi:peptidoglycan-binding domain-containing protein [Limnofasciculus baicalensis]|uniref:Peptidoglycan-binding protein n=1 Tax=Limnofasciculus baicalensis BBK-W-15 TaxID=2699891 RepID=A0AAE3KQF9_9CYAN|nr:peptidoglycan-binding protein [Limnofasciculus baicalensis]MCP2730663.1 peptidoglycan-binding protein [Limnofasciculus baicalensis BBK-W-15]
METLAYIDLTLAYEAPASTTAVFTQENLKHCHWFNRQNLSRYARRYLPPLFILFSMFPMTGEAFVQILKQGSQGPLVTQLQERLLTLDYFHQEPTGYFGSKTKDAVMQFQGESGLNRDGVVGQATWSALFGTNVSNQNLSSQPYFLPPDTDYPVPSTRELDYNPPFADNPDFLPPLPNSVPIRTSRLFPGQILPPSNFSTPRPPDKVVEVYSGRILQRGARGKDVEQLQQALRDNGFNPGAINGIYGEDTEIAVMEFQRFHNFHVDGVAGSETLKALGLIDENLTSQAISDYVVCP